MLSCGRRHVTPVSVGFELVCVLPVPHETIVRERVLIDNLLVGIHSIIEMILVDRSCALGV